MSGNQQLEKKTKKIEQDNLIYEINEDKHTAGVVGYIGEKEDIIIPLYVNDESQKYEVTSILKYSFRESKAKSLQFAKHSKVFAIKKRAFSFSEIESIKFPSSLIDLEDGWCFTTPCLNHIEISPNNPRYCCFDDIFVIGKSSIKQSEYDCLVFCARDAKKVLVPNFIKHICPYAFEKCVKLTGISFTNESNLQTIGKYAFSNTSVDCFVIPPKLVQISECTFCLCKELRIIEFPFDSQLKTIESSAFIHSGIREITIPSSLIDLKKGWCQGTEKLTRIRVSPTNPRYTICSGALIFGKSTFNKEYYDCLVFCARNVKLLTIPHFIEHICSFAFESCKCIQTIEFPINSKLQTINESSFAESSIESLKIPKTVKLIGKNAFFYCSLLDNLEIDDDSELQRIDNDAFLGSAIQSINIPSKLVDLKERWCNKTLELINFKVSPNNPMFSIYENKFIIGKSSIDQDYYSNLLLCVRDIETTKIPDFIENICCSSFNGCKCLREVEFSSDSKLKRIGSNAFFASSIEVVRFPSQLIDIGKCAFSSCDLLKLIIFPADSNLQIIEDEAFLCASIESISIPPKVKTIGEMAFSYCDQLQIIELDENSELSKIEQRFFEDSQNAIIMIPVKISNRILL